MCYYNEYGEADPEQDLILEDRNSTLLDKSYLNIKTETDHVQLVIERSQLGETGSREAAAKEPLVITGDVYKRQIKAHASCTGADDFLWSSGVCSDRHCFQKNGISENVYC